MKNILFIDDEFIRATELRYALPVNSSLYLANSGLMAGWYLSNVKVDLICLDHDMGTETGYQIAERYIIPACLSCPVIVHSLNPTGRTRTVALLQEYAIRALDIPISSSSFIPSALNEMGLSNVNVL